MAKAPPLPDVTEYDDYRKYLLDWYAARKAREPGYSHTVFSRKAGLPSRSHFPNAASGELNLTGPTVERFAQGLGLSPKEREYFRLLVAYTQAAGRAEREALLGDLRYWRYEHGANWLQRADVEALLARWPRYLVLCLTHRRGFRAAPAWIARTLAPRVSRKEAEEALRFLRSKGYIRTRGSRLLWATSAAMSVMEPDEEGNTPAEGTAMLREAADLRARRPRHTFSVRTFLTDAQADALAPRIRKLVFSAFPTPRGKKGRGRLYAFLGDLYPLSR